MVDITIETGARAAFEFTVMRAGPFWRTSLVGYFIGETSLGYPGWYKTADGGATWSAINTFESRAWTSIDCWADWQTPGDAGTKIHIAGVDSTDDDVKYTYLDTADDSEGAAVVIETGAGDGNIITSVDRSTHNISITKTVGGNLAVTYRYTDNSATMLYGFKTSPDGTTWTSKTSPWDAAPDYMILFPANLADNQDLWALYWDIDATEISLKTFDNSGNSWAETSISGATAMTASVLYLQMDGAIRFSDGHLILAAWNLYDNNASDLMTWDITNAGTITAKGNVKTDSSEYFCCSVFIDQNTNDIYVAYVGEGIAGSSVHAQYKKSVDGGANWTANDITFQADDADDERWIGAGAVKREWGGKFQPVWFNDDMTDLFTNVTNGIEIAAAAEGWANIKNIRAGTGTILATDLASIWFGTTEVAVADIAEFGGVAV